MFNDERINAECGKIYGKGILLAVLTTLVYVISRTVMLIMMDALVSIVTYTECVILLLGIGILLIGTIRFNKNGDERISFARHNYYKKAGKAFILTVLGAYILTIPFTSEQMLGWQSNNHLLMLLELIGYLYLFYAFKTKQINFNYSFIDKKGFGYYGKVLTIIGGLWLGLLIPFVLAAYWELVVNESWVGALAILLAYIGSAIGLSVEYFFISLVEKLSYDSINGKRFALGTRIAMLVLVTLEFIVAVLQCVYIHFASGNLQQIPNTHTAMELVNLQKESLQLLSIVLLGLVLSHIMSQIKKGSLLYSVCAVKMLLLALSALLKTLAPIWYHAVSEKAFLFFLENVYQWLTLASLAVSVILWLVFARAMTKELSAPCILWIIPVLHILIPVANVYFNSQGMLLVSTYCAQIITIGCLILLTYIIWQYRGFSEEDV